MQKRIRIATLVLAVMALWLWPRPTGRVELPAEDGRGMFTWACPAPAEGRAGQAHRLYHAGAERIATAQATGMLDALTRETSAAGAAAMRPVIAARRSAERALHAEVRPATGCRLAASTFQPG